MAGWFAAAAPFLAQGVNMLGNWLGAEQQQSNNMDLAKYQYKKDMQMLRYQLKYNSPEAQMNRFKEAGLNPNLVYGQGSPGNMESAPKHPQIQPADYQSIYANVGTNLQQARLLSAQADLTEQKVGESGIKQDLMRAQESLVKANPYLNKAYAEAMVTNLKSMADIKAQEAGFMLSMTQADDKDGSRWQRGFLKMQRELDLLEQKFNLGKADQKIKGQVLESKEFQNALQEIQLKWMKDSEITPQHIYQGIMMLLSKMM